MHIERGGGLNGKLLINKLIIKSLGGRVRLFKILAMII